MSGLRILVLCGLLGMAGNSSARALAPEDVPAPLKPWVPWVLYGEERRACPFDYDDAAARRCAWPSQLSLQIDEHAGRFTASWRVYADDWLTLPGDARYWPQDVTVNGDPALVFLRDGRPTMELPAGDYRISGRFAWDAMPESFPVPAASGILRVTVKGRFIDFPDLSGDGKLWLKERDRGGRARAGAADSLSVQVFRRVIDAIPMRIETQLSLEVGGDQREVVLGPALLEGFIPLALSSRLPARVEADGSLRVQLRPGRWTITLVGRSERERVELALGDARGAWPETEVWAFEAHNEMRLVEIEGVPSIDPRQTRLPPEWQQFPSYRMRAGDVMRIKVIRRGDPQPEPNQLALSRQIWLDFDGGGFSVNDHISGSMTQGWRLEAVEALDLGRVVLNGEPQFITSGVDGARRGVEVRRGAIDMSADSRWTGDIRSLPAVGWAHDFQRVDAVLHLPPGWTLLSTAGIDEAGDTWIQRWTLLDLFLVLIAALAIGRLWNWRWGALALATLVLIWHEPDAPRTVWLHILGAVALLRVLPPGRIRWLVKSYRNVSVLVLIAIAVPFLVDQVRTGLYPQLERPWQSATAGTGTGIAARAHLGPRAQPNVAAPQAVEAMPAEAGGLARRKARPPAPAPSAYAELQSMVSDSDLGVATAAGPRALAMTDPGAKVQTGPGMPRWEWTAVPLRWHGPVERDQMMQLRLLSPGVNLLLDVLRVGLLAWLVALLLQGVRRPPAAEHPAALLAVLVPLLGLLAPAPARADFPSEQMLSDLKARLLEAPECLPACAEIPRMRLEADPGSLSIRMEVLAARDVAIPLPAHVRHWLPADVSVDGEATVDLYRTAKDELWLLVRRGRHQVILSGPLPPRPSIDIPLPLRPRHAEAAVAGWTIDGVHDDGQVDAQLQLSRLGGERESAPAEIEAAALPPFVSVERTLRLGLDWYVETRVRRLSPRGTAVVIEVPLLAGEAVTTPDVRVEDGRVQVSLAAGAGALSWESTLEKRDRISLRAPETTAWTEIWKADIGPLWHVVPEGIAVIHHQSRDGQWLPEWRPWPGEAIELAITRPPGVEGRTLTIDQSDLELRPGKRATDVELRVQLRSSQGGQHTVTLPEAARLQSVSIDGAAQPVRQEGRSVTLPVHPGTQQAVLSWRESPGITSRFASPAVDLGAPSVNSSIAMSLGRDRWVLLTGGPSLGPAVLFWGVIIVIAVVALGLGRIPLTPLNATSWMLLGIGLSQVHIWLALVVVGWLLALGWRARLDAGTRKLAFNLVQIGLPLLTLAAFVILFQAIKRGLLGLPEMQIGGNGSSAYALAWYQDRAGEALPRAWVWSAPLLAYRVLMLAWALWLAFALLRWLKWGWSCYSAGGLWRPFRLARGARTEAASEPAP